MIWWSSNDYFDSCPSRGVLDAMSRKLAKIRRPGYFASE